MQPTNQFRIKKWQFIQIHLPCTPWYNWCRCHSHNPWPSYILVLGPVCLGGSARLEDCDCCQRWANKWVFKYVCTKSLGAPHYITSWKFLGWGSSPDFYNIVRGPMSLIWAIFTKFKDGVFFFLKKCPFVYIHFWPFSPIFSFFWTSKHPKHQKRTNWNPLEANRPKNTWKWFPTVILKFGFPKDPKTHPGPKMPLKRQEKAKIGPVTPHVV